jgi:hypothetical protein
VTGNADQKAQLRVANEQRQMATRDMLLTLHRTRKVEFIETLGAHVAFVSMGASTRDRIEKECGVGTEEFDRTKYTTMALVECIEDPKLTEADLQALADQDLRIIDELVMQVTLLNVIGGDPEEAKKALQKIKNSDSDSSSPSG